MVSISQLTSIQTKVTEMRRIAYECINAHIDTSAIYCTPNQPQTDETLPPNYAIIASVENNLTKYTLDPAKWVQNAALIIEVQVDKLSVAKGEIISRSLRLLYTNSFASNDTVVTNTTVTNVANAKGTRFNMIVEYNFII